MTLRHFVPTVTLTFAFAMAGGTFVLADGNGHKKDQHNESHDNDHHDGDHHDGDHHDNDHHDNDHDGRHDDHGSVCHHDDDHHGHTIDVDSHAIPSHLAHGDELGSCPVSGSR